MKDDSVVCSEQVLVKGKILLTYTLTKRTSEADCVFYSLLITEVYKGKEETARLFDLTDSREEAMRLFSIFLEGRVTVCTAEDVLVDVLYTP